VVQVEDGVAGRDEGVGARVPAETEVARAVDAEGLGVAVFGDALL